MSTTIQKNVLPQQGKYEKESILTFLNKASSVLVSSLDYETTLKKVSHLAVPAFADWCAIYVTDLDSNNHSHEVVVHHQDPEMITFLRNFQKEYPQNPQATSGVPQVIRTGKSELTSVITDKMLETAIQDKVQLEKARKLHLTSVMTVPLIARRRVLGAITLASAESGKHYTYEDLKFAEDLARRAAIAVDNARLYNLAQQEIKKREATEKQIILLNKELEERVLERTVQLEELQHHLQLILDSTGEGIYGVDSSGNLTFLNPAGEQMLGWKQEEILGQRMHTLSHSKKPDGTKYPADSCAIFKTFKTGMITQVTDEVFINKAGEMIPVEYISMPIKENGEVIGAVVSFRDISKRIEAENTIKESEHRYRSVVSALEEGIILQTKEGIIETYNKSAERILGLTSQEFKKVYPNHVPWKLVTEQGTPLKENEHPIQVCLHTGKTIKNTVLGIVRKQSEITWISINVTPLTKDTEKLPYAVVISFSDITERKNTEKLLLQIKQAIESSSDAIGLADAQRQSFYHNDAFIQLFGYTPEELNKAGGPSILYANAAIADEVVKNIHHDDSWKGEVEMVTKSGKHLPIDLRVDAIKDEKGNLVGIAAAHTDITERIKAQIAQEALTRELRRSNKELQDFASVASHDLQEPLRKIQAFGDRLQVKFASSLPAEGKDYIYRMQHAAYRMQNLINDLLTFSRVTSKAQPFVKVDLNQVIKEVMDDLEVRIENTNGKIIWHKLPVVYADPLQMRQLFQNLLGNGLKFHKIDTPPVIAISSHKVTDEDTLNDGVKQAYEIRIEDNGIGFDEKYLDRIFNVFQRLHTQAEYSGTGVGLAVCRKIVERHHGHITASSRPGKGATFVILLPCKPPKEVIEYATA